MTSPFNERAALDELERFRQEIERERARRRSVSDEFDSFIRSFKPAGAPAEVAVPPVKAPVEAPLPPVPPRPAAAPTLPPIAAPGPADPRTQPASPAPTAWEPSRIELPREASSTPSSPVAPLPMPPPKAFEPAARQRRRPGVVVGVVALLALAVIAWMLWRPIASPPVTNTELAPATEPGAVPAAPGATATGDPANARPAGESAPLSPAAAATELTTIRHVWVRVIVDGERVLERELPAGSRIPLTPTRTIVIRTGDAGAVSLTIAGQDQGPLGREGQVVTRTFEVTGR